MKTLTLKKFTEQTNINSDLVKAVVKQIGGWQEFKERSQDICGHGANGGFSGFIYYSDTVKFTENNKKAILELAKQLNDEIGESSTFTLIAGFNCLKNEFIPEQIAEILWNDEADECDKEMVFNALAWFALEETARSFCDLLESTN